MAAIVTNPNNQNENGQHGGITPFKYTYNRRGKENN